MEFGWAFWWIIPMMIFFCWGSRGQRRYGHRDPSERPERAALDEETRARLATVDQLETRVSELENRLDFSERLLAQRSTSSSV